MLLCASENTAGSLIRAISALVLCIAIGLIGCAASQPIAPSPIGIACLGRVNTNSSLALVTLFQEMKTAGGTVLTYYKEAPIFDESFSLSKGSTSGVHHGCWAHLLLDDDRVVGVEYKSVPRSVSATDHCEESSYLCSMKTALSI